MFKQILSVILLTSLSASTQNILNHNLGDTRSVAEYKSAAVLELFTSEGCNSCPAADRLATRLQQAYKNNLIVLEFHVDYWDRLGWKDPFSNALYTQRQLNYGNRFHLKSIYTPQAVINGKFEAVGSDEARLTNLINSAIKASPLNLLEAGAITGEHDGINIKWKYLGAASATIHFALVQKQAATDVKGGENRGRKLNHTNIVREFISVESQASNKSVHFTLPEGLTKSDLQVIGYVEQDSSIVSAIAIENL